MDLAQLLSNAGLSSGKIALIIIGLNYISKAIGALRNGEGLVGVWRSIIYGQAIPKVIAQDYKEELKPKSGSFGTGSSTSLILILCGILAMSSLGGLTGCATLAADGPYKGDKVLYIADQTDLTAYKVIHAFVLFEYENRTALASHPEIKAAADDLRQHAPDLFKKYDQAREAYVIIRSPETLAAFNASVDELKSIVTKATNLLFASQSIVSK